MNGSPKAAVIAALSRSRSRADRIRRGCVAEPIAALHAGVATRRELLAAGLTTGDIRGEVEAGRWVRLGRHTVGITVRVAKGEARLWWALWESGSGAVLDGVSALVAGGMTHWEDPVVVVSVPASRTAHRLDGVRLARPRDIGPAVMVGLRRTRPEVAAVRAAQWAATDRQAATIVAMTVQQRLTTPERLLRRWHGVHRSVRRELLDQVVADVCDGAHSLGELDFAVWCRRYGLPPPSRQQVRVEPNGTVYLDVWWDAEGVHVEIDGVQHDLGLARTRDALRQNEVAIDGGVTTQRGPFLYGGGGPCAPPPPPCGELRGSSAAE